MAELLATSDCREGVTSLVEPGSTQAPVEESPYETRVSARLARLQICRPLPSDSADCAEEEATAAPESERCGANVQTRADARKPRAPIYLPARQAPRGRFITHGYWEGVVEEVRDGEFDATLVDIHRNEDDISLTFPRDDVSIQDLPLLQSGAVFYWIVGYLENAVGQRSRVAEIKFRRLPTMRTRDLAQARQQARRVRSELGL